jgi:hypothetical protein
MKRKKRIVLSVMIVALLAGFSSLYAQDGRRLMNITYGDGGKQTVRLNKPSGDIVRIDFTNETMGTKTPGQGDRGREYTDSKGGKVFLPCGKIAFADRFIAFNMGNPAPRDRRAMSPEYSALGEPDYVSEADELKKPVFSAVTLGCGGSLTLEFTKVRLVDVPGPDLHVFEVGPAVEPTRLEISKDGVNWINIGKKAGGKASVDIHPYVSPGDQFRYVRLTDLKSGCGGDYPGADIDAVGAIGCVVVE